MHKELFVIIFIIFSSVRWYGSGGFTSDERVYECRSQNAKMLTFYSRTLSVL